VSTRIGKTNVTSFCYLAKIAVYGQASPFLSLRSLSTECENILVAEFFQDTLFFQKKHFEKLR
jgi:hypothetical protein